MYGIDVATYQRTLDMNTVRNAGNEFSGVKAVASFQPKPTIAADYQGNVDRILGAGLRRYDYAVPNSQVRPEDLAAFQWSIRYRPSVADCYMLDNEPLDAYKVFWNDDYVFRYWNEMHNLGCRYDQMIEYCPAALTRAQSWPKLKSLREQGLMIQWVSYGDMDPYYEDGEQPFVGNTGLTNPDSHQFTSSYTVPGYNGLIDRVFSRLTLDQMFRGATSMPRSPQGAFAWAANEAKNGNVLTDWAGWCEKFVNNAGAFNQAYPSALRAGDASGPLRGDYENAPIGAIVYWAGVGGFGHVAFVFEQGSDPLLLMASSAAKAPAWGHNIGLIRLSAYQRLFGHPLRGWTLRHGTETLNFGDTAGDGSTIPIDNSQKEYRTMSTVYHWAEDSTHPGDVRPRGGILFHEFLGPIRPSSAEEAIRWKDEFPPAGGIGQSKASLPSGGEPLKTDIDGATWDILNQSCINRNLQWRAQQAAAGGGDPDAIAQAVLDLLGPQLVQNVVNAVTQQVDKSLDELDLEVTPVDYEQVKDAAERALRETLGAIDSVPVAP